MPKIGDRVRIFREGRLPQSGTIVKIFPAGFKLHEDDVQKYYGISDITMIRKLEKSTLVDRFIILKESGSFFTAPATCFNRSSVYFCLTVIEEN